MTNYKPILLIAIFFIIFSENSSSQINEDTDIGWRILDEDKCMMIIKNVKDYFSKNDNSKTGGFNYSDKIYVFQEYGEIGKDQPIKGLEIGKIKIEPNDLVRIILGEELFDAIRDKSRYPYEISSTPEKKKRDVCHIKGDEEVWWMPLTGNYKVQVTGPWDLHFIGLVNENWWGIEAQTGIEELNYPSIFSGTARAGVVLEKFRIGLQFPIGYGNNGFLGSRKRILDAGLGAYLGFNEEINNRIQLFGNLFYSDLTKRLWNQNKNNSDSTYFLTFGGLLGLSFNSDILLNFGMTLKFSIGAQLSQVGYGYYDDKNNLQRLSQRYPNGTSYPTIVGSPYIKLDFCSCNNEKYHFYLQYANLSLMAGAWYNIIDNIDFGFTSVFTDLLRKPKEWEYPSLIIPQFRVRF
jgi:hypothetical protein